MSGIVGSRLNIRGSGLVGSLGTDGQVFTSAGAGVGAVYEAAADNTPYAVVRASGNTTISDATWTTVTLNNEILDSDGAFSSNTFTVPSGKAGKYLISYSMSSLII